MSHIDLYVFIALIMSLIYTIKGENHATYNQGPQTYIISIQNNLRPSNFANVEEWYKFILSKTNSNSNSNETLLHVYNTVFHGFSARLRPEQANLLRAQVEVTEIFQDQIYQVHTTRSPYFLGLNTYRIPIGILKESNLGSNVVVGVIDTGIWPESSSFSDEDLDPVPAHFKGVCNGGKDFSPSLCNKKIVGVRYISSFQSNGEPENARDIMGHGTHTASTIAGRTRPQNSSFFGYAKGEATGIAPKARLAIYKVCSRSGCHGADVLSAIDKAVEDGVDVISISLGSSLRDYSSDPIAIGAFGAIQKGVIVSASAGNSGPDLGLVSNSAPWLITVGASTIDRTFPADVILDNNVVLSGISLYTGKPLPSNETFPLIHFPSDYSKKHCLPDSLEEKDVKGKIVICFPGISGRVEKGVEVKKAGGVGIIVAMDDPSIPDNDTLQSDPFLNPGITIPLHVTIKLLDYINNQKVKEATLVFHGTRVGKQPAPIVAHFSSRGPNMLSKYILKPDMIAPGVDIMAAWPNNIAPSSLAEDPRRSEFNFLSGTSMSCPHVSGVAALLKGAHQDWTPAMVRSALMTTSYTRYHKMDVTTQNSENKLISFFDIGAGHVDPEKANNPGLVFDITEEDYLHFLCASNYTETEIRTIAKKSVSCDKKHIEIWDLNYPAIIATPDLYGKLITRSLTTVDLGSSSYTTIIKSPKGTNVTISPVELRFKAKGEKQKFTVTIVALGNEGPLQSKAMGSVTWTNGKRNVTIPLTILPY